MTKSKSNEDSLRGSVALLEKRVSTMASRSSENTASIVDGILAKVTDYAGLQPSKHLRNRVQQAFRFASLEEMHLVKSAFENPGGLELNALVEDLTIHETYFFRDSGQMELLRTSLLPKLVRQSAKNNKELRIWSGACATGEEPFSLAMLAIEAIGKFENLSRHPSVRDITAAGWKIRILGTDISSRALRKARKAEFSSRTPGSFRHVFLMEHMRWFCDLEGKEVRVANVSQMGGAMFRLDPEIQNLVEFQQHNLLDSMPELFDLVTCRNVLVYMCNAAREKVGQHLKDSLSMGGVMLLGPSDMFSVNAGLTKHWAGSSAYYAREPVC